MSISVQHITKIYGTQKALDQISFEIPSGQIVGFLGPNGAGKSTMMKILSGYIPQTSGNASVNGFDINTQSMDVRKSVGYLPESNPLYVDMYVKEYLSFIAGLQGIKSKKQALVAKMIEMTGLGLEQKKKISMLSKGYRQRVGIAQALIHDPKVLILDEPTSGLDPNQLLDIRNLIKEIGKEKTVMLSTHIMQEVEAVCHRVIIINRGLMVADNSVENMRYDTEADSIVIEVEFDNTPSLELLKALPGILAVTHLQGFHYAVKAGTSNDIRAGIFKFAVDQGLSVLAMKKAEASLEEIFQKVTGKKPTQ